MTTRHSPAACQQNCAGGRRCACGDHIGHTLHICNNADCVCHTPTAYGLELASNDHSTVYVPTLRRLYEERSTQP